MKANRREFLKTEATARRLRTLAVLFLVGAAHAGFFYLATGLPFSFSYASERVIFQQSILMPDPVESVESIKKDERQNERKHDFASSDYRIVSALEPELEKKSPRRVVRTAVAVFSGQGAYADTEVILEINSNPFLATTKTDSQGRWSWANYGEPLEEGEHTIVAYNISPYEISGKRDVFSAKYNFTLDIDESVKKPESVGLQELDSIDRLSDSALASRLTDSGFEKNAYFFQVTLLDKEEYHFGDTMSVNILLSPLKQGSPEAVRLTYGIYYQEADGRINEKPISFFEDRIVVSDEVSLLKRIDFKKEAAPGKYVLKIEAHAGSDKYVQSARFSIGSEPVLNIAGTVITEEKLGQVVAVNVIFLLLLAAGVSAVLMLEYRRFLYHSPISEDVLKERGYFSR